MSNRSNFFSLVFLFTCLCAHDVWAQSATLSIPQNLTAKPGATSVTVPVQVTDLTGLGVISVDVVISYETTLLTATGIEVEKTLAQGAMAPYNIDDSKGKISLAIIRAKPFSGSGTLLFIRFKVDSTMVNESSHLDLTTAKLNSGKVLSKTSQGKITLVEAPVNLFPAGTVSITQDDTNSPEGIKVSIPKDLKVAPEQTELQVPVIVSDLTGLGIVSANLIIIYDFNVLEATGATLKETIAEGGTLFANPDNANGAIRIGLMFSTPQTPALSGSGVLVYLDFKVKSTAQKSESNLSIVQASFNSDAFMSAKSDGKITVKTLPTIITKTIKANTFDQFDLFNLTLIIPAGAITEDKTLEVEMVTNTSPLLGGLYNTHLIYDLRFYGENPPFPHFAQPLILTFHYWDESVPSNIDEESLRLYSHENALWKFIGGTVDTQSNTVTVGIDYLSTYSLFAGYAYGDVSGDGKITAIDAALVLQTVVSIIGELPPPDYFAFRQATADVSGNGKISAFDASMILRQAVGLPPHPWHSERPNFPVLEIHTD